MHASTAPTPPPPPSPICRFFLPRLIKTAPFSWKLFLMCFTHIPQIRWITRYLEQRVWYWFVRNMPAYIPSQMVILLYKWKSEQWTVREQPKQIFLTNVTLFRDFFFLDTYSLCSFWSSVDRKSDWIWRPRDNVTCYYSKWSLWTN